jgi:hypothetical protein
MPTWIGPNGDLDGVAGTESLDQTGFDEKLMTKASLRKEA